MSIIKSKPVASQKNLQISIIRKWQEKNKQALSENNHQLQTK